MGPLEAPLQKAEFKVYDDRVVVERRSNVTGVRVVASVRRPLWRIANVAYSSTFLVIGSVLVAMGLLYDLVLLTLFGLIMASPGVYGIVVVLWLEGRASSRAGAHEEDE